MSLARSLAVAIGGVGSTGAFAKFVMSLAGSLAIGGEVKRRGGEGVLVGVPREPNLTVYPPFSIIQAIFLDLKLPSVLM